MAKVIVLPYNPKWPEVFQELSGPVVNTLGSLLISVEHIGSTSVPGLAAKPIIDLSVIVEPEDLEAAKVKIVELGYQYLGDLGVEGRDAFRCLRARPRHNFYLCPRDSLGLRNHLAVRDYLRANPEVAKEYGELKLSLAQQYPESVDKYTQSKTDFIIGILKKCNLSDDDLLRIEAANKRDG